jgi:hypothetical protein
MDEVMLCQKVEGGFLTICAEHKRQHGMELEIPASLDKDILRWRQMAVRYKRGDMRHTEAEYKSLKVIAQWTVSVNCKLRGQPDKKVPELE